MGSVREIRRLRRRVRIGAPDPSVTRFAGMVAELLMDDLGTFAGEALRLIHTEMMNKGVGDDGKPLVPASVRVDAAKYLVDQFIGKAKVSVDVHEDNSLLDLMGGLLVNPDGVLSHHIVVDGGVVDTDDDPDGELRSMD